ncbi:hypothetical protein MBANPS3_005547 [Mucor bainieri]
MSAPWHRLPAEILSIVFKAIPDVDQVARCRLVCRAWNPVAEKEMFSKNFDMPYNKTKFIKIIRHLLKQPSLGSSITCLQLNGSHHDSKDLAIIKRVLQLAVTPNIKMIYGRLFDKGEELIPYLYEIVSKSKTKFAKLERLPFTSSTTELNAKFINLIRDSVKELQLTCSKKDQPHQQTVLDHLDKFKSLTKLVLCYEKDIDSFVEMENILKKCPHLEQFELNMGHRRSFSMPKDELKKWLVKNVKKHPGVHKFKLGYVTYPEVAEYLHYKFPKATSATLNYPHGSYRKRLLPIAEDMDDITVNAWNLYSMQEVKTLATAMKSQKNSVKISDFLQKSRHIDVNVSRCKSQGTAKLDFCIFRNKKLLPAILSIVGDVVDSMEVAFSPLEKDDQNVSYFYTVLTALPSIKKLQFVDVSIKDPPLSIKNTVLQHLTEVEINGTKLNDEVLPTLSKIAPNLKHLTLGCCYFDSVNLQQQTLSMPDSSLETMCLKDYTFRSFYEVGYDDFFTREKVQFTTWIRGQMEVRYDEYMFIQVTESATREERSFILKATDPTTTCKLVSKEQFNANVGNWPCIQVNCRSLRFLEMNFPPVETTIDLRQDWTAEDVGDWNFYRELDKCNLPPVDKTDSMFVRMRKEDAALMEYYNRPDSEEEEENIYYRNEANDPEKEDNYNGCPFSFLKRFCFLPATQ